MSLYNYVGDPPYYYPWQQQQFYQPAYYYSPGGLGWECPKCHTIYAPSVQICWQVHNEETQPPENDLCIEKDDA